jgi:biopolymer transport protein ExbB/TolQ
MNPASSAAVLRYRGSDPEARIGLPPGRHTNPSTLTTLLLGVGMMTVVVGSGFLIQSPDMPRSVGSRIWQMLIGYQGIAPVMVFLACWSLAFLAIKGLKIRSQRAALALQIIPRDPGFVLTRATAIRVVQAIESGVEGAPRFLYLKRILTSLRSMRNVGRVADVDDMLQAAASNDQSIMESGYTMLRGFMWAIPVLGFIGTVLGLTDAMGKFGVVLSPAAGAAGGAGGAGMNAQDMAAGLSGVLGGLETAFVTTGEALVLVLFIHVVQIFVREADETLLDDAREEAHAQIGARVRLDDGVA